MTGHSIPGRTDHPALGIAHVVIGMMFMVMMDSLVKYTVSEALPVAQLIFVRGLFVLSILAVFLPKMGGVSSIKTKRWQLHLVRGLIGSLAPITFFTALQYVSLADMTVIGFASTFIAVGLCVVILKETVGIHRWMAVLVGFVGVIIVMRPGSGVFQPVALLGLITAAAYATINILTRKMVDTESPYQLVISFNLILTVVTGAYAIPNWQPMEQVDFLFVFGIACLTLSGHVMITRGYSFAPVAILVPFEYTALIWAAIIGYFVFGEVMDMYDWVGAAVIVGCGLYITYRESHNRAV